eukprot:95221_1
MSSKYNPRKPNQDLLKLFVVLPDGKQIDLNAESSETILNITQLISKMTNICMEQHYVTCKGQRLINEKSLSTYNIQNEAILNVNVDALAIYLTKHNLFRGLYKVLRDNDFDLEMLQNDLPQDQINEFCSNLQLNAVQQVKFQKLMRVIYGEQNRASKAEQQDEKKQDAETKLNFTDEMKRLQKSIDTLQNAKQEKKKIKADYKMEIAVMGDMAVGKTSLVRRYVQGKDHFNEFEKSTIGVGPFVGYVPLSNNKMMQIKIWDTAGQERFESMCSGYYRRADGILLCYDVNSRESLDNCENWRKKIENYGKDNVFVVLVGCKGDLQRESRGVTEMIKDTKWEKFDTVCCECSAKTGDNVANVFLLLAENMMERIRG